MSALSNKARQARELMMMLRDTQENLKVRMLVVGLGRTLGR